MQKMSHHSLPSLILHQKSKQNNIGLIYVNEDFYLLELFLQVVDSDASLET